MDGRTARELAARIRAKSPHLIVDGYAPYAPVDWVLHITDPERTFSGWIYTPEQWDEQVRKEAS